MGLARLMEAGYGGLAPRGLLFCRRRKIRTTTLQCRHADTDGRSETKQVRTGGHGSLDCCIENRISIADRLRWVWPD